MQILQNSYFIKRNILVDRQLPTQTKQYQVRTCLLETLDGQIVSTLQLLQ